MRCDDLALVEARGRIEDRLGTQWAGSGARYQVDRYSNLMTAGHYAEVFTVGSRRPPFWIRVGAAVAAQLLSAAQLRWL